MAAVNLGTAVVAGADASVKDETAGEAILAGQAVYRESATRRVRLASTASAAQAEMIGVALNSAPTAGQPIRVQWGGTVENTATLVVGEPYFVADAAGSVMPSLDIGTGDFVTLAGIATAATKLRLGIVASGVAHA